MSNVLLSKDIVDEVITIAISAGSAIMDVYKTDFSVNIKDDKSPVTEADTKANEIITNGLLNLPFNLPILSEEGASIAFKERSKWKSYWLVDPLDGTKEFVKKNDEFTVNIALMDNNIPIFGVVYAPVFESIYWGGLDIGSFKSLKNNEASSISVRSDFNTPIHIATSRSHPSLEMDTFLKQFMNVKLHPMGSSLKMCSVAEGSVHLYPRLGPTMEWDTAASHAIVKAAGGELNQYGHNIPLIYNKENLLNPKFIAGSVKYIQNLM